MKSKRYIYRTRLQWTGASVNPNFKRHDRSYRLSAGDKPVIEGSSDAVFRGDNNRWNPEDLLVASLAARHHLWYLGLCAEIGLVVTAYEDEAEGVMIEKSAGGGGQFLEVVLRPRVTLAPDGDMRAAEHLHQVAHEKCFVARSVNFPVKVLATISLGAAPP